MRRQAIAVIVMAVVFGCASSASRSRQTPGSSSGSTSSSMDPPAQAMSDTQLAAHAGNADFPRQPPSDGRRVAAIVTADRRTIKLYNFENTPINAVNVWVNQAYVQPLRTLPAHSKSLIRTDKLFNKGGRGYPDRGAGLGTPRGRLSVPSGIHAHGPILYVGQRPAMTGLPRCTDTRRRTAVRPR